MKIPSNAHTHSTFSDGRQTPKELAEHALALGFTGLGYSCHSPAPFDPTCPGILDEGAYIKEIDGLKQAYKGRLDILCGVEQDYYGPVDRARYDYIIGSVHYLKNAVGEFIAMDGSPEELLEIMQAVYGGDVLAMVRAYYDLVVDNARRYKPDIIGHFDLIVRHNRGNKLFDEDSPAYRDIALSALDAVIEVINPYGGIIEVNTGGVNRGYRDSPYPAPELLRRMAEKKVRVMINSDCHDAAKMDAGFDQALECVKRAGFTTLAVVGGERFVDIPISGI